MPYQLKFGCLAKTRLSICGIDAKLLQKLTEEEELVALLQQHGIDTSQLERVDEEVEDRFEDYFPEEAA